MTEEHKASRTLVKSPPELWAECSVAQSLARHLGEFGEIRITRLEPETTVAWEGEHASGTVRLEPSGWGTQVTLTATPIVAAAPEPAAERRSRWSSRLSSSPSRRSERDRGGRDRARRSRSRRRRPKPRRATMPPDACRAGRCSRVCGPAWVASPRRSSPRTPAEPEAEPEAVAGRARARSRRSPRSVAEPSPARAGRRPSPRRSTEPGARRRSSRERAGRGAGQPRPGAPPPVLARLTGSGASGAATPEKPSP